MIAHLVRVFDKLTARERAVLSTALAEQENFGNYRPRTPLDDRLCKHFVEDKLMSDASGSKHLTQGPEFQPTAYELTDKGVEVAVLCITAEGEGVEA